MDKQLGSLPRRLVVFTGAGMSAESGVDTFRTPGGIWERYAVEDVATPEAWARDPDRVTDFYNQRRRQLVEEVEPHLGHRILAELEAHTEVQVITQNVDDLHERSGSSRVLHLHGELRRVRSSGPEGRSMPWSGWEVRATDRCSAGYRLRPDVVWFGEEVPNWPIAEHHASSASALLVIGTSLQVYPAAGLVESVPRGTPIFLIDPASVHLSQAVHLQTSASSGLSTLWKAWLPGIPLPDSAAGRSPR